MSLGDLLLNLCIKKELVFLPQDIWTLETGQLISCLAMSRSNVKMLRFHLTQWRGCYSFGNCNPVQERVKEKMAEPFSSSDPILPFPRNQVVYWTLIIPTDFWLWFIKRLLIFSRTKKDMGMGLGCQRVSPTWLWVKSPGIWPSLVYM